MAKSLSIRSLGNELKNCVSISDAALDVEPVSMSKAYASVSLFILWVEYTLTRQLFIAINFDPNIIQKKIIRSVSGPIKKGVG
jgi:hypothetical protein